eukprot:6865212-Prymnesium_polylepis.1
MPPRPCAAAARLPAPRPPEGRRATTACWKPEVPRADMASASRAERGSVRRARCAKPFGGRCRRKRTRHDLLRRPVL